MINIDRDPKQGVELKMPDEKYKDIPPNQTGFAKAAVDRCVCVRVRVTFGLCTVSEGED
jgi:hypothetical protein